MLRENAQPPTEAVCGWMFFFFFHLDLKPLLKAIRQPINDYIDADSQCALIPLFKSTSERPPALICDVKLGLFWEKKAESAGFRFEN